MPNHILLLTLVLSTLSSLTLAQLNSIKEVNVQQGKVRGQAKFNSEARRQWIYSFNGIPYAAAPIGDKRFKLPEEPDSFSGVFEARESVSCPQSAMFSSGQRSHREDCLTLDVYVTQIDVNRPKPVLVYLPGGGRFKFAMSSDYGPRYLLDQDQLLVVVNYRVGILGFLSTEDRILPGNLGLFDQQMALKWIFSNIGNFGGDKNKVTLMGHDSGAVSVSAHILNTESRRYFQQAVLSGGSLFSPWAFHRTDARRHAQRLGPQLGCHDGSSQGLLDCFKGKSVDEMIRVQDALENITFVPVVDTNYTDKAFFKEDPFTVMEKGTFQPLPMILGMVKDSGLLDFNDVYPQLSRIEDPNQALTWFFKRHIFPETVFDDHLHAWERQQLESITKSVKYMYFRDIPVTAWFQSSSAWIEALSDLMYKSAVDNLARKWSKRNTETYVYHLEYSSSFTFRKVANSNQEKTKSAPIHMDDVFYFFNTPYDSNMGPVSSPDFTKRMRTELVMAINKFLKEGQMKRPISGQLNEWLPYSTNDSTLRIRDVSSSQYMNEARYRAPQLDLFSVLLPEVVNRTTDNVFFDSQESKVSYGAVTWVLLILVLLALAGAIGYIVYLRIQKRKRENWFEVPTHIPGEKLDLSSSRA